MKKLLAALLILSLLCLSGCQFLSGLISFSLEPPAKITDAIPLASENELAVSFLDVGQGDAVLLYDSDRYLLIDTGPQEAWDDLKQDLDDRGVRTLEYLVLTHPHADHIGCAIQILNEYGVKKILMPDAQTNTRTFEKLLDTIIAQKIPVEKALAGNEFTFGNAKLSILSPEKTTDVSSLNNASVVLRAVFGTTSFLFTGDAEAEVESAILNSGYTVRSDVLKVAHHGSNSSSTKAFLKAVRPQIAVISVGEGNSYGHPKSQVLSRLQELNASIYRTDQNGTVTILSDGTTLSVTTEK